jgi:hypothetical protein
MVAAGFTSQNLPFISVIYGKDDFLEVQKTRMMAEKRHREHHQVVLEEDYLSDPWTFQKKGILLGNAEEPGYLAGRMLYMRWLYKRWSQIALNGLQGRYYKDGLWNELYVFNLYREPRKFDIDLFLKYRALNKNYDDFIFTEDFRRIKQDSGSYFRQMVEESLRGYEKSPVALQVDKFDIDRYGSFGQIANSICNNAIDLISPLFFRRNLEIALQSPVNWKYNLSPLQRALVYNLDPKLAAEKTDLGGLNMVPKTGFSYYTFLLRYWYAQSKKFRDKIKTKLKLPVKTQLQKAWEYYPIHQQMFRDEEVQQLLKYDQMRLSNIVEKQPWQDFIRTFEQGKASLDQYEYLFKILSIEYFLHECEQQWELKP